MRLVVVSDSHRAMGNLFEIIEMHKSTTMTLTVCSRFILCSDITVLREIMTGILFFLPKN